MFERMNIMEILIGIIIVYVVYASYNKSVTSLLIPDRFKYGDYRISLVNFSSPNMLINFFRIFIILLIVLFLIKIIKKKNIKK